MQAVKIHGFTLAGYSVLTTNQDEMQPATAKIGELWTQFYSQQGKNLTEQTNVYGVYTDYESDFSGKYRVFAAADTLVTDETLTPITIDSGLYYVFSAQGELPNTVIELWGHIWEYFSNEDTDHQRAYTADFEHFKSPTSVDIYIALKEK